MINEYLTQLDAFFSSAESLINEIIGAQPTFFLVSSNPEDGAIDIDTSISVLLTFSEPILNNGVFVFRDSLGNIVNGGDSYGSNYVNVYTFGIQKSLELYTLEYTVNSESGGVASGTISFTTKAYEFKYLGGSIQDGTENVPLSTQAIYNGFSGEINVNNTNVSVTNLQPTDYSFTVLGGTTLVLNFIPGALQPLTEYVFSYHAEDLLGNIVEGTITFITEQGGSI